MKSNVVYVSFGYGKIYPYLNDKFDLAPLLGKTESGMKTEFYIYQIKEFMKSVGVFFAPDIKIDKAMEVFKETKRYGADEISVPPYLYPTCKNLESKFGRNVVKFGTLIDYPNGESSFKGRIADVKDAVKNGLDVITLTLPTRLCSLGNLGVEKSRINKLYKVSKHCLGVAVKADILADEMKKIVKMIDSTKVEHITLLAENLSVEQILDAVKIVNQYKGWRKVYVYSNITELSKLSTIIESKVDKVYTPNVSAIGRSLTEKFGITM